MAIHTGAGRSDGIIPAMAVDGGVSAIDRHIRFLFEPVPPAKSGPGGDGRRKTSADRFRGGFGLEDVLFRSGQPCLRIWIVSDGAARQVKFGGRPSIKEKNATKGMLWLER